MPRPDPLGAVEQMLENCIHAMAFAQDYRSSQGEPGIRQEYALLYSLVVMGEAANRLPGEFHDAYPTVPWRRVIDFRNFLVHRYDVIDMDIVLAVVDESLPPLIVQLREILEQEHQP